MSKILIINGPNLNMLGLREPEIYGHLRYVDLQRLCEGWGEFLNLDVEVVQSNHEGALVDTIHQAVVSQVQGSKLDGSEFSQGTPPLQGLMRADSKPVRAIIINGGAYAHTSIALVDALRAFRGVVVSVHVSNIHAREPYRHHDRLAEVAQGCIVGLGVDVYRLAMVHIKAVIDGESQG